MASIVRRTTWRRDAAGRRVPETRPSYATYQGSHADADLLKFLRPYLDDLKEARTARAHAEARIEGIVQSLRAMGCSWAVIAKELGVSKQAAAKRYGRVELVDENGNPR